MENLKKEKINIEIREGEHTYNFPEFENLSNKEKNR